MKSYPPKLEARAPSNCSDLLHLRRIGRAPKLLLVYRVETPHEKLINSGTDRRRQRKDKDAHAKVEVLAKGQQFVAFGIHPDTSRTYRWSEKSPLDISASRCPLVTLELLNSSSQKPSRYCVPQAGEQKEMKSETTAKSTNARHRSAGGCSRPQTPWRHTSQKARPSSRR